MTAKKLGGLSIAQIEALLADAPSVEKRLCALLEKDGRVGVRRLGIQQRRRLSRQLVEAERQARMLEMESALRHAGARLVAGVDEVGRGCLAGPVVAAAVILDPDDPIAGLDDSKRLKPERRIELDREIGKRATGIGIGMVEVVEIDRLNILQATMKAMRKALLQLHPQTPDHVLIDGSRAPGSDWPETTVVDGDARCASIAAASIVAKVHRDRLMADYDRRFPGYGFSSNKGYGSAEHRAAIDRQGPCALHRQTFQPMVSLLEPGRSQLYLTFQEGFNDSADTLELESLGRSLAAADGLSDDELEDLRTLYRDRRRRLSGLGPRGEAEAAAYLQARGYRIVERQYRGSGGEVDLIAAKGQSTVFVEVKARARDDGEFAPAERVRSSKKASLTRAARHYIARHASLEAEYRFDVMAIYFRDPATEPRIEHIVDAFQVSMR